MHYNKNLVDVIIANGNLNTSGLSNENSDYKNTGEILIDENNGIKCVLRSQIQYCLQLLPNA